MVNNMVNKDIFKVYQCHPDMAIKCVFITDGEYNCRHIRIEDVVSNPSIIFDMFERMKGKEDE